MITHLRYFHQTVSSTRPNSTLLYSVILSTSLTYKICYKHDVPIFFYYKPNISVLSARLWIFFSTSKTLFRISQITFFKKFKVRLGYFLTYFEYFCQTVPYFWKISFVITKFMNFWCSASVLIILIITLVTSGVRWNTKEIG